METMASYESVNKHITKSADCEAGFTTAFKFIEPLFYYAAAEYSSKMLS
jgi:hypothetical protein